MTGEASIIDHRCTLHPLGNATRNFSPISCNSTCNADATINLKALANKVLERNATCNSLCNESVADLNNHATIKGGVATGAATKIIPNEKPTFDHESYDERAAIIEANGIPSAWAEGFATLCTMPRPVSYSLERWRQLVNDGGLFLDKWGRQAAGLGWSATDVFGVNPSAPETIYCDMGLVPLLQGRSVIAITADTARIDCGAGITHTFTRKTMGGGAVALWEDKACKQQENNRRRTAP